MNKSEIPLDNQNGFSFLFGSYLINISEFFKTFSSFKVQDINEKGNISYEPLRVIYGTPTAAFRKIQLKQENKVSDLPIFNFWCADFERLVSRENPFCRANLKGKFIKEGKSPYNQNTTYVGVTNDPQSWDLSLQCSLWTSTYKTRDDFMAKILMSFKGGTLYLPWLPDPLDTDDVYWQEVRMDMNFSDETEVEGLDEKDPRAIIRTTFNLKTTVTLPYFIFWIPAIKSIQINDETFVTNSFQRMDVVTEPGIDPLEFVINPVSLTF